MRCKNMFADASHVTKAAGKTIEYALVLGLIIVVAIAIIGTVGTKVVGRWTSVNNSL